MKKNGFTIVEVLAVIIILALIMILVVPNILSSSTATKQKAYETKIFLIEDAAIMYGQDHYREIVDNANDGVEGYSKESTDDIIYRTYTLKVKDLIPDYLESDNDNGEGLVTDPRDNLNYLDENEIVIKINTNTRKVTAKYTKVD